MQFSVFFFGEDVYCMLPEENILLRQGDRFPKVER